MRHHIDDNGNVFTYKSTRFGLNAKKREEKPKTVVEQINAIVEEMCQDYCKWPDIWIDDIEHCELSESSICRNCPLNRLG